MKPIAISAVHQFHETNKAIFSEIDGWMVPNRYAEIKDELEIVERFVGINDVSSKVKLIIHDEDAVGVLSEYCEIVSGNNCKVMIMKSSDYGFEFILNKLTSNQWLILGDQHLKKILIQIEKKGIPFVNITSGLTGIRLVGPKAKDIISTISSFDIRDKMFPNMSVAQISVMHQHAYLLRLDIVGKVCYEIYVGREIGLYIWNQIIALGNSMGIAPIGNQIIKQIITDGAKA